MVRRLSVGVDGERVGLDETPHHRGGDSGHGAENGEERRDGEKQCAGGVHRGHGGTRTFEMLAAESAPHETNAVGDRQNRPENEAGENEGADRGSEGRGVEDRRECGFLADEPEERWQPGHARGGKGGDDRKDRSLLSEVSEFANIAGARRVVDDADHHEQRRLEHRVRQHHRQAGQHRFLGADADENHQEAQLADRAEGEDEFEVECA